MAFTHSIEIRYKAGDNALPISYKTYSGGAEPNISESITAGTDTLVACVLDVSQMKTLFLYSDVAMTIKTNSSGAPAATVTLAAGQAIVWTSTSGLTNPFGSTDVTALYVTNAATGTLTMGVLVDPTV